MKQKPRIIIIGAGNVASHLGNRLFEKGFQILQIFSRGKEKAKRLASKINADFTTDLNEINDKADLYIFAIPDDRIGAVAMQISQKTSLKQHLFVHTSGATPSIVFQSYFPRFGVFYPLQTFSISRIANFEEIPICIDANNEKDLELLEGIAANISPKAFRISDEDRAKLHVAAVFVNNFTNHLFHIGTQILEEEGLSFEMLKPLIKETVAKLDHQKAIEMQTGPAKRGDQTTISRHLEYLQKHPVYQDLYQKLSQSIQNEELGKKKSAS